MDRLCDTHDEFFQRSNRPKRTPHRPDLRAKSSESQGVSCPTILRENSLESLGDSDRMKEVVHIPCPKRKSSAAKVVASFQGERMKCNAESHDGNRGARELFKKNPRSNVLNHAAKPNAQWLVLSSQDRVQKPNHGYIGQRVTSSIGTDPAGKNSIMKQPLLNSNQGMPTLDRVMWRNVKGAKEEQRKTPYGKPAQFALQSTRSQLKPQFQAVQRNINAPPFPRLKETVLPDRGQPFSTAPMQGYLNIGSVQQPSKNLYEQHPQIFQDSYQKKDGPLQNPYDANRLLMNSYNLTYDGPHHNGPHSPGQFTYPSAPVPRQMEPSFFQSHHITPGYGVQQVTYTLLYNVSMPSENPKIFQNTNETRSGPWAPGSLEVDIPPGYPHQPKLPKTTTRSYDAVNIQDLPKGNQKIPVSNNQPSHSKGAHQYQPFSNEVPQQESWRFHDGLNSNYQYQQNPNVARQEAPVMSYEKPGVNSFVMKTTLAYRGVFGKLKKEESKLKMLKPSKISVSNAQTRLPVIDAQARLPLVDAPARQPVVDAKARLPLVDAHARMPPVDAQGGPDEYASLQPQQGSSTWSGVTEAPKLQNSFHRHQESHFNTEAKAPFSKAAIPLWKTSQDRNLSPNDRGHQEYLNFSGDMSHILEPPVTMDANLYSNKAHKIASKFVSSQDVTYVPFRGVPPARNDEAFYDKNLHFLGKIDRPPLVNTKKRKWCKLNWRFNVDRVQKLLHADYPVGLYSEPVDFHSEMSAEDSGSDYEPKTAGRHYRKCHHKRGHNWLRLNSQSRTKA